MKLPEGIFAAYANGVRACVVFLEKGKPLDKMWMFDGRKNLPKITTKSNSLKLEHFEEFILSYGPDPTGNSRRERSDRFIAHTLAEIKEKEFDLSFTEIFKPDPLQHPTSIIDKMIADYRSKIETLEKLKSKLPKNENS
ncbi:N-6 DNA methylase [Pedobacter panaciterrae]